MDLLCELPLRVDVEIELRRFGVMKRRADGTLDFISPMPCPYNYGSIPGRMGGDGDPLDALVLGRRRKLGRYRGLHVLGVVDFVDAGADDPKVICSFEPDGLHPLRIRGLGRFFGLYARFKTVLNHARRLAGPTQLRGIVVR
ncbi:MAG: inorganic diphosphatase [Nannocystaceae bacterium]